MPRHPANPNLHLHDADTFYGFPIQADKGPFIRQYLSRLLSTMERATAQYNRVFAFRCDLRLPVGIQLPEYAYTNEVIERFIESFKAKIEHNRAQARRRSKYAHDTQVRYVWAREIGEWGRPHYHLVILLNQDAFYSVGKIASDNDNMFHRLHEAWASALRLPVDEVYGLVEVPDNATYRLSHEPRYFTKPTDGDAFSRLFYRASYLCKAATKVYGDGRHGFGCSRF